jgi:hypothetical protein
VAIVFGANCRPTYFDKFWIWIEHILPYFQKFHMVGLAGICWTIEVLCSTFALISYWAELKKRRKLHFTSFRMKLEREMREWYCFSNEKKF